MKTSIHHAILIFFLPFVSAATQFQTTVTAKRPTRDPHAVSIETESKGPVDPYPWLLLSQAGLSASPSAGALSLGNLRYRGFSSLQLSMSIDGFDLASVGTGIIDVYDLPLFASKTVELTPGITGDALGGSLGMKLRVPSEFGVQTRGTFGSHAFGLIDLVVASGDHDGSRALLGLQLASSRGDYAFRPSANYQGNDVYRSNNSHTRMLGFLKAQHAFPSSDFEFLLLGRQHEGGLAGPATFPSPHLRLFSQKLLVGASLGSKIQSFPVKLRWESHFDRNQTSETHDDSIDSVAFLSNKLTLRGERRFEFADTFSFAETTLATSQITDGSFRRLSGKLEFGVNTAPFSFWNMRFRRSVSMEVHSDVGWFLGFGTNISATPIEPLTFGIRFAKKSRPPTLSEMFAPQGLILGNPNLEPEKVYDSGLYASYTHDSKLQLNMELFYAYLTKAIFYVNRDAFFMGPINADKVHRGGLGFSLRYDPTPYFQMATRADWLLSHISLTGAALPGTAPLALTIDARIGKEKGIFGRLGTVVNAGASSNLFGTLRTEPYALFNASLHVPVNEHARLALSMTNLANTKWAKSAYHYPMPGFEFFVTLETNT